MVKKVGPAVRDPPDVPGRATAVIRANVNGGMHVQCRDVQFGATRCASTAWGRWATARPPEWQTGYAQNVDLPEAVRKAGSYSRRRADP
jgi:hypothetical protein